MEFKNYLESFAFKELQKEYQEAKNKHNLEATEWWNNLSEKEREDAFYMVCKKIHEGDVEKSGSYRYVLYDVFGFDMGMYGIGMECGYMDIHNLIGQGKMVHDISIADKLDITLPGDIEKSYDNKHLSCKINYQNGKSIIEVQISDNT